MARVNHKLVKQRLNEKRSKITDKQFFSSRMLAGHFEDLAAAQTRRYHYNRRVRVNLHWWPKDAFTAATDNMQIRINTGHPLVTKVKGRENRYQIVCGMFAHELGHVLFTDFLSVQTYHNYLDSFKWYPRPPAFRLAADARNEKAFWEYVKEDPKNLQMVHQIAANIANIIEDGYIENRMLNSFPGTLGYGLETLRERHFVEINTVTELIAKETDDGRHILESILQIMLSYAKFGRIKYGDEPKTDERVKTVFGLIDDIDEALMNRSGKERWNAVNTVMIRCWEYIQDFCEVCKERQEEAEAAGGTVTVTEALSEILGSIAGTSEVGSGTSTPVPEASGNGGESATLQQGQKQGPRHLKVSLTTKTLLPKLNRKTAKTHLSLEKPRINQMILKMLSPAVEGPAPESSKPRNPKKEEFRTNRQTASAPLSAVPLRKIPSISASNMIVRPRISNGFWTIWRKRLPARSWRANAYGN